MQRDNRQKTFTPVAVDPALESAWQAALLSRPDGSDPAALTAWNNTHGDLLARYQRAVDNARSTQRSIAAARTRLRRGVVATVAVVAIAVSGIVYWSNQPSEDELLQNQTLHRDAACAVHYEQTHGLHLVGKQVDLLGDGEGGWIELHPYSDGSPVGDINLSPADLQTGRTGTATVNREAYVHDSTLGLRYAALLERHGDQLVLTLLSYSSDYGNIPRDPLQATFTSQITVQGEQIAKDCW